MAGNQNHKSEGHHTDIQIPYVPLDGGAYKEEHCKYILLEGWVFVLSIARPNPHLCLLKRSGMGFTSIDATAMQT